MSMKIGIIIYKRKYLIHIIILSIVSGGNSACKVMPPISFRRKHEREFLLRTLWVSLMSFRY